MTGNAYKAFKFMKYLENSVAMAWTTISIFGLTLFVGIVSCINHPRIIGGHDAKIRTFPYQVSIRYLGKYFCSGSIISNRHILTAAHCASEQIKDLLTIHSGTSRIDKPGRNVYKVLSVDVHPEWNIDEENGYSNDIAVLTLEDPIVFGNYQNKVDLPNQNIENFQKAYLTGWGSTSNLHNKKPTILQQLRVEVMTSEKCQPLVTHKISNKQICSFKSPGAGACFGDDGGPLVSNRQLVGIVSFVDGTMCGGGTPDIYTNVFAYKDFIESVMNK